MSNPEDATDQYSKLVTSDQEASIDLDRNKDYIEGRQSELLFSKVVQTATSVEDVMHAVDSVFPGAPDSLKDIFKEDIEKNGLNAFKAYQNELQTTKSRALDSGASTLIERHVRSAETREAVDSFAEKHNAQLETAALADAALKGVQINHPDAIKIDKAA